MPEMSQATAGLRLLLAEIASREEQLNTVVSQFRTQLARLPRQAIYGRTPLDLALSAMGEIEERLDHAEATRRRIEAIKRHAQEELKALELTRQVEEAKQSLQELRVREAPGQPLDEEATREIRRLEKFIAEYSRLAEQAITATHRQGGP